MMNGIVPPQVMIGIQARVRAESQGHTTGPRGVNLESRAHMARQDGVPANLESQDQAHMEDHGVRVASQELEDRIIHGPQARSHHRHGRQSLVLTSGLLLLPFVIHQHQLLSLSSLAQPPLPVKSVLTTMYGIGTHLAIHAITVPTKLTQLQDYLHFQLVNVVVHVLQLF